MGYVQDLRRLVGQRPLLLPGGRAIVLNDADDVLLHRRVDLDIWDLPGGSANIGESQPDAVLRELTEETGLTAVEWLAIGLASDPDRETVHYPNGDAIQGFALILLVRSWQGTLRSSPESRELRWFPRDQPPSGLRSNTTETLDAYGRWTVSSEFQLF